MVADDQQPAAAADELVNHPDLVLVEPAVGDVKDQHAGILQVVSREALIGFDHWIEHFEEPLETGVVVA